jgi:prepilin-type N-terminal cleavage/methylation domain-containing protein
MGRPLSCPRDGFTLVEVLLSMLLLGVGIGAVLHTSVLTVRMMVRGRQASRGVQAASAQLEALRAAARFPPGTCAELSDGADTALGGTARRWRIGPGAGPREAIVTVLTAVPGGYREDSLSTVLPCP